MEIVACPPKTLITPALFSRPPPTPLTGRRGRKARKDIRDGRDSRQIRKVRATDDKIIDNYE
jgi:hypothetical protein